MEKQITKNINVRGRTLFMDGGLVFFENLRALKLCPLPQLCAFKF